MIDISEEQVLVNKKQAAELLGVSVSMINKMLAKCHLRPIKIGRSVRINKNQLLAIMETGIRRI